MTYNIDNFIVAVLAAIQHNIRSEKICGYFMLSPFEKNHIMAEAFMRGWKSFWYEYESKGSLFNKSIPTEKTTSGSSEVKSLSFPLKVKNPDDDVAVVLEFIFKSNTSFEVKPTVTTSSKEVEDKYLANVNRELENIRNLFQLHYTPGMFLRDFFESLHNNGHTIMLGKEAVWMYKIYNNAIKYYPVFKCMPLYEQIALLQKAYFDGRKEHESKKDIYRFAKSTFDVFANANILNCVVAENPITRRVTVYKKIGEQINKTIGTIFVDYQYDVAHQRFRTSILSVDLWSLLCSTANTIAEIQ